MAHSTQLGVTKRQAMPRCLFVLFGATGDLAARKIAPALYNLARENLIDLDHFGVVGVARRGRSDEQFRREMHESLQKHSRQKPDAQLWERFSRSWHYHQTEAGDSGGYEKLAGYLKQLDEKYQTGGNCLFYLAMTPDTFGGIIDNLGSAGLNRPIREGGSSRLVVEKPFGHDLRTARELNKVALKHFNESNILRIDHYLGKETVQNILALRFANAVFEPLLNRHYVKQVQVTVSESAGMEGRRGPYYEESGALRDMVQNHMFQLLSLMAMDPPVNLSGDDIRNEKVKVIRNLCPFDPQRVAACTVRGQYSQGKDSEGNKLDAYRDEAGVADDSQVETFVAIKLCVDTWRWSGVPFYLRTGKRLPAKASQIVVIFKREPANLFTDPMCNYRLPNRLVIRIGPDEGASLIVDSKVPGPDMILRPVEMAFRYESNFGWASPEAYEHLLLDAMMGETTLFIRNDEVEASWRFIDSIRLAWQNTGEPKLHLYPAGSWGPSEAEQLFQDPYRQWHGL